MSSPNINHASAEPVRFVAETVHTLGMSIARGARIAARAAAIRSADQQPHQSRRG